MFLSDLELSESYSESISLTDLYPLMLAGIIIKKYKIVVIKQ